MTTNRATVAQSMGISALLQPRPPGQPAKPAKPASQASQPGQPGIEASGLQASMSAILLYRGSSLLLKGPTGRHRADNLPASEGVPQAATGRITFPPLKGCHRPPQVG